MAINLQFAPAIGPGRSLSRAHVTRKVAMFGSHGPSLIDAPWNDESWELWGHATSRAWFRRPMDRYFDLHPKVRWTMGGKKGAKYPQWLAKNTVPIYMQRKYDEVPASIEYPKGRILQEFSYCRPYFTNHIAWMIALALTEGVTTIGLFGVNYQSNSEYVAQRGCCEYWLGIAQALGVRVVLPEKCTLLAEPKLLYGYESHDETTGLLRSDYANKLKDLQEKAIEPLKPGEIPKKLAEPPPDLVSEIEREEIDFPRPEWALGPLPETGNGNHKESLNG